MTFLCRSLFFSVSGDFWSMSFLGFDVIWISHVGSLGLTFLLDKQKIYFFIM